MRNLTSSFIYEYFVLDEDDSFIVIRTEETILTEEYFGGIYSLENARLHTDKITRKLL